MRQFLGYLIWIVCLGLSLQASATSLEEGEKLAALGRFEQAIEVWKQQAAGLSTSSDPSTSSGDGLDAPAEINRLARLAEAYQALGMHQEALLALEQALALVENRPDPARQARVLGQASDAWLVAGDIETSLRMADRGVELARQAGDKIAEAAALLSLGNALAALEQYPAALETYGEAAAALATLDAGPLRQAQGTASTSSGTGLRARIALNQLKTARTLGEEGNPAAVSAALAVLPDDYAKASKLLTFAALLPGALPQAFQAYEDALRIADALDNARLRSLAYGGLAGLRETQGQISESLELNRRAVFFASQGDYPDILYRWQWRNGRLFRALGQRAEALAAYREAGATLTPVRQQLYAGYRMPADSFDLAVRPVYYGLADLLLQQAAETADPPARQDLLRAAREAVETLKQAELEDYFRDECVTQGERASLDQVIPGTAVVYPIPLPDRLEVLLGIGDQILQIQVPAKAEEINGAARELRGLLQTRQSNRFLQPARKLYHWLIRPLENSLAAHGVDTLVFVTDGPLRAIPPASLHDGERFLIERYAVAVAPGLTLVDLKSIDWRGSRVLLAGLSEGVQHYPPLPNVPKELNAIGALTPNDNLLIDKTYSLDSFRNQLERAEYSVVHLATHGEFSSDPDFTYLLTYDGKMTMDKLQSLIGLGRFRKIPVELLTLSACRTAVGDDRAALGLAGVALKAGARSAIATLWFVDDESTALAMQGVYRQLNEQPGLSKAKALQAVQKQLLAERRYWHPIYWSPFLLIGNWL